MGYSAPRYLQVISAGSFVPGGAVVPLDVEALGLQSNTVLGGCGGPLLMGALSLGLSAATLEVPPCPGLRALSIGVNGLGVSDSFTLTLSDETGELVSQEITADGWVEVEWHRATDGWLSFELEPGAACSFSLNVSPIPPATPAKNEGLEAEGYLSGERLDLDNENGVSVGAMNLLSLASANADKRPQTHFCFASASGHRCDEGDHPFVADLPVVIPAGRKIGFSVTAGTSSGPTTTDINLTIGDATLTLSDFVGTSLARSQGASIPEGVHSVTLSVDVPEGASFSIYALTIFDWPEV